ncbi:peroxiredoxin [Carboxydochorda subterranea]|uniref:Peroxiredoxin n=1 Tax=Carboxydichorda subterranea TaxID=3109565 RepID=A0ABZ1BVN2_9FIRM|nr:peroxiredoxin [Limnochorda sp. L945t]WRP16832.1 peroxiredoxin [Limnochorda sp. L945t]
MVKVGTPAPDFTAQTTQGPMQLSQLRGQWVLLFAHPGDFTPVCTTEFMDFARKHDEFVKLNTKLIGLSIDTIFSHIAWLRDIEQTSGIKIPFPVIADPDKVVARLYDLVDERTGQTIRGVFVIDPEGILRFAAYYPIELGRYIPEFLRIIKALQTSDKYGVATPANWQPGEEVVVGAPKTLEEADRRLQEGASTWYILKKRVD